MSFQRSCARVLRSEFQRKNFCFEYDDTAVFVSSQVIASLHLLTDMWHHCSAVSDVVKLVLDYKRNRFCFQRHNRIIECSFVLPWQQDTKRTYYVNKRQVSPDSQQQCLSLNWTTFITLILTRHEYKTCTICFKKYCCYIAGYAFFCMVKWAWSLKKLLV